jgi:hypothetical protein
MNANKTKKPVLETQATEPRLATPAKYEAPRITRKHSLERVTLTSGTFAPGGQIGGD